MAGTNAQKTVTLPNELEELLMLRKNTRDSVTNTGIQRLKRGVKKLMLKIWGSDILPQSAKDMILYLVSKKLIVGVLAVIVDREGRILLFEHTYLGDNAWGIPGGAAKHEDLREALRRELQEESRYRIDVRHSIGVAQYQKRRIDFLFACSIADGQFTPSEEVSGYGYFHLDELPKMAWHHRIMLDRMAHTTNTWPRISTSIESFFLPLTIWDEEKMMF